MSYLKKEIRKEQVLTAAMVVAERDGYNNMRRIDVAEQAGCANGTVNTHFTNMTQLRNAVMRRALKTENLFIVAQGVIGGNKHAIKAPPKLKEKALQHLQSQLVATA